MADYSTEAAMARLAAFTPDELDQIHAYGSSPRAQAEWQQALDNERDPAKRAILEEFGRKQFNGQPRVRVPGQPEAPATAPGLDLDGFLAAGGGVPVAKAGGTGRAALAQRAPGDLDAFLEASQPSMSAAPAASRKRTWGEAAKDTGLATMSGLAGVVKAGGDIYGVITGDFDNTASELGRNAQEYWNEGKSDVLKAKEQERKVAIDAANSIPAKAWEAFSTTVTDPALMIDAVASNIATMIPGIGAGRAAALAREGIALRAAAAAGPVSPAARAAAAAAAGRAGTAAAVGTGAVQQGADVASNTFEEAMRTNPEALLENAEWVRRVQAGEDPEAVLKDLASKAGQASFAPAAAISLAANAIPGSTLLEKALVGGAARNTIKEGAKLGLVKSAAKGAAGEATQEAIEEGGGQFAGNVANQQFVDPNRDLSTGVGENAGVGAAAGFGMGAAGGVLQREASKLPEAGPLTRAANRGIEAGATSIDPPVLPPPPPPVPAEAAAVLLDQANQRAAELETKAKGTKDQKIDGPDGKKITVPGEQPKFLTPEEKDELAFLKENGGDAQALAQTYGLPPPPPDSAAPMAPSEPIEVESVTTPPTDAGARAQREADRPPEPSGEQLPDDIVTRAGFPFKNITSASRALAQAGEGFELVAVKDGLVVRRTSTAVVAAAPAAPAEASAPAVEAPAPRKIVGEKIDDEWTGFAPESGTKAIPRAEMPQIKAEHRGAMTQFLAARGITHEQVEVPAGSLKPTQAEFSPAKVQKAREFDGGDRSILISADGHVLDGHHQWLARAADDQPIKAIRLDAPIEQLLDTVKQFPSAEVAEGATAAPEQDRNPIAPVSPQATSTETAPAEADSAASGVVGSRPTPEAPSDATPAGPREYPITTHTTGKGKTITGVLRTDLTLAQAKEIDAGSFKKDGGVFVRERALGRLKAFDAKTNDPNQSTGATGEAAADQAPTAAASPEARPAGAPDVPAAGGAAAVEAAGVAAGVAEPEAASAQGSAPAPQAEFDPGADAVSAPTAEAAATPVEQSAPAQRPRSAPAARARAAREAKLKDYFAPGNIVKSYGGFDEVLDLTLSPDGGFSVKVHEVRKNKDTGQWVRVGKPQDARQHSTFPDARELAAGPVARLDPLPVGEVPYTEPRADGKPFSNAVPRGAPPEAVASEPAPAATAEPESATQEPDQTAPEQATVPAAPEAEPAPTTEAAQELAEPAVAASTAERPPRKQAEPVKPAAPISDFGEKLEGARKDYAALMTRAKDADIAADPLSKSWPEPDYQKLLDGGADPMVVAWVRAARDEIPTKPQTAWKLKGWVQSVELLRDVSFKLLDGRITKDSLQGQLDKQEFANVRRAVGGRAELYEAIGHDRSLKGVMFEEHRFSLYRGQKNVTKWVVEQKAKATAFGNWPREIAATDTKEEALAQFKAKIGSLDLGAKAKGQPQFVIYRKRGVDGAFVGKKIGREYIDLKKLGDLKEARAYLEGNTAALEAALAKYKETPAERRAANQPRVGDDHRGGAPVTPEVFQEAFGFRGVQFGNYVEQGRRQSDLNEAYDALMDLSAVLGIAPRALSLNGQLGLSFGARGKGGKNAPAAHFETGQIVINLTKGGGPGSLAHEWWHALDNYFARKSAEKSTDYVTSGAVTDRLRVQMRDAFMAVKRAIQSGALRARSGELDKRRSKPYWSTPEEMAARSFESYIIAKLQDQSAANDYLANVVSQEAWDVSEAMRAEVMGEKNAPTYPYPTADELPGLRAAFDEFFKAVETRETDAGTEMFSLPDAPDAQPAPEAQALQQIAENDDLFALPKSTGTTIADIAPEVDPQIKVVKETRLLGETMWTLEMPDGKRAFITQRRADQWSVYNAEADADNNVTWSTTPPYSNPDDVPAGLSEVFIDVSKLEPGGRGTAVYAIAGNFAHNTGAVFIGDPAGLSDAAMRRRPEQMLSSALKWGTTAHLAPHPRQLRGDPALGIPPLKWVYGDDVGNIYRLIELNVKALDTAFPDAKKIDFDLNDGQYRNAENGRVIDRAKLNAAVDERRGAVLAQRPGAELGQDTGTGEALRRAGAGSRTVARSAVLRAVLREARREGAGGRGRDGVLARLASVGSDFGATSANKVFYSIADDPAELNRLGQAFSTLQAFPTIDEGLIDDATNPGRASDADRDAATKLQNRLSRTFRGVVFDAVSGAVGPGGQRGARERAALATVAKRLFGHRVVFLRFGPESTFHFNGVVSDAIDGVIFLDVDSERPLMAVLGHELLHQMRKTQPGVFKEFQQRLLPLIRDEPRYRAKLEAAYAKQGLTMPANTNVAEELRADIVGDFFLDGEFWKDMATGKPRLFQRVVNAVLKFLDDVAAHITKTRPFGTEEYLTDIAAARKVVAASMGEFSQAQTATSPTASDGISLSIADSLNGAINSAKDVRLPAGYVMADFMTSNGKLSFWDKTVGTMNNLAQKHPAFKRVYDAANTFINDVSHYATEAADLAPKILPKLDSIKDIAKSPLSAADTKAIAAPIFEGTLLWGRDDRGRPVKQAELEARAAQMPAQDKAREMLRRGVISEGVLKMWQGLPLEQYEANVESRYASQVLKPGVVWSDGELRTLFKQTDEQIALYREFRAAVNRSLTKLALSDMLRFGGKDVAAMAGEIMEMSDVDAAAEKLRDALYDLAEAEPDRAKVLNDTAEKMIDKAERATDLMARGYAPLSRFGRYTLDVVQDGERAYFGMFESQAEANRMARKMREQFPEAQIAQGTTSEEAYKMFAGVSPETLELFGDMLGLEAQGDGRANAAFQTYLKAAKSTRSAMKRLIERKGIAGFSEDAGRVLAGFVYSNARQTSANLHLGSVAEAVTDIPQGQGELRDMAVKLSDYVRNPQEEAQAIRGLLFAQYLGGSLASALVNTTQPFAVTFPYLSQYGGAAKAAGQVKRALTDVFKKRTGDADLDAALKRAEIDGIVSPQEVFHLQAQAAGKGVLKSGDGTALGDAAAKTSNAMSKIMLGWGKLFGVAEQFNRRVTFIAAYRTAVEQGQGDPSAWAANAVNQTQFVYTKANRPRWARGAVGSTLFTFKTYTISYLELMHRLWSKGGPEGRKAALLGIAMLMLMSGADGLPFAEDVSDLIDGALQRMGYNFSSKQAKEEFLSNLIGRGGARFVLKGVSGLPGVPLDVSGRLGMGNVLPGTGLLTLKQDYTRDVVEFLGPVGDLARRTFQAGGQLVEGEPVKAATTIAPTAIRNVAQALDMATMGMYRDATGKKVIDTDGYDAITKAIGFQPNDVARVQDATRQVQQQVAVNKVQESKLADQWARGVFERDPEKVREARAAIADWNAKNPEARIVINTAQIARRVKQMRLDKTERLAATAPREIRASVKRELDEARQ